MRPETRFQKIWRSLPIIGDFYDPRLKIKPKVRLVKRKKDFIPFLKEFGQLSFDILKSDILWCKQHLMKKEK